MTIEEAKKAKEEAKRRLSSCVFQAMGAGQAAMTYFSGRLSDYRCPMKLKSEGIGSSKPK
jgi:hypothetical protein